jgi:hypothetical protein
MMKKNYNDLIGKTKKEVLDAMENDQFNDPHSNVWTFYLGKEFLGKTKILQLFFTNNVVEKTRILTKNFWQ